MASLRWGAAPIGQGGFIRNERLTITAGYWEGREAPFGTVRAAWLREEPWQVEGL